MASIINASPTNGIVQTADGSGALKVQSNGVTTNALAWVNFNGTGTVAIRSSYNVSSITDNGTGDYTVNFTTATTDANYAATIGYAPTLNGSGTAARVVYIYSNSTTACRVTSKDNAGSGSDFELINVAIFGN